MPFSSKRIFLEETSLVACPGVPMDDIKERMVARLSHLGIKVRSIEEDEHCVIPMGGPLSVLPQRVVGIGGTAGRCTHRLDIWWQGLCCCFNCHQCNSSILRL
ncbi:lycopene beta cyclase, chloroplastic chromoplastic [Olea europaea subsp. europaea]|uniref:Lycopene beta cyclase, chloroplastic chromoplastic n=1 Tax=Olea europaea subsp. europaea TaxID=158383 RepID=A0A8S0TQ07_OLEEU|nr:lycopene beta cyclase, chloroplastic chromoplastic [Olea europaea subsp. europaea]